MALLQFVKTSMNAKEMFHAVKTLSARILKAALAVSVSRVSPEMVFHAQVRR